MNIIDLIPGEFKKVGNKNGGEFAGGCPWCGDGGKGGKSDRFHIWPEQGNHGTYWCRMCGKGGDAIKFLIDHRGMDFKAACAHLGLHPDILGPKTGKPAPGWQPQAANSPADVWADHARKFVDWCHERLLERKDEQDWLAERGIGLEMIEKYRLGYNPAHAWREGSAWGVTLEKKADGKMKKLWLPRGLVIPMINEDGRVHRLRIRQPDQEPRYLVIPGSGREPLCSREAEAMFVVESELDAILLDGIAGDLVGVVAMGNDTAKPTARLNPALVDALFIGVALDSDRPKFNPVTDKMDMPGAKASRWWLQQFPQAVRVPMVGGKDPGDAFKDGVDLRLWVLAALPAYFHVKADLDAEKARKEEKKAAEKLLQEDLNEAKAPVLSTETAEIKADNTKNPLPDHGNTPEIPETCPPIAPEKGVKRVTLKNGRSFCLASSREEWEALTDAGEIVFSEHELNRLQAACQTMSPEERLAAAMQVLDFKEIFGSAWIKRGEVINNEGTLQCK